MVPVARLLQYIPSAPINAHNPDHHPAQRLSFLPSYAAATTSSSSTINAASDCALPTYSVKSNPDGKLKSRAPDVALTRHRASSTVPIADVRFDRTSKGTAIIHTDIVEKSTSGMRVESSIAQRHLLCLPNGQLFTWAPSDQHSKRCFELRSKADGTLIACWTYTNEPNRWARAEEDAKGELGILQIHQGLCPSGVWGELDKKEEKVREKISEQVISSLVALLERIKRRSVYLSALQHQTEHVGASAAGNTPTQM